VLGRLAALVLVLAVGAALAPAAPAAHKRAAKCGKRAACRGAVRARGMVSGLPLAWRAGGLTAGGGLVRTGPAGGGPAPGGSGGAPSPPPPPPPPPGNPRFLQVTSNDADPGHLYLTPSRTSVSAGNVTVEFNNAAAQDPHDLRARSGSGGFVVAQAEAGEVKTQVVSLTAGTWTLYCGIAGHEALGMKAQISVLSPG
jgi:plastocyanin